MKKTILAISILLIFTQNMHAERPSEKKYNATIKQWKDYSPAYSQVVKCERDTVYHASSGNANECLKAIKMLSDDKHIEIMLDKDSVQAYLPDVYLWTGVIYKSSNDRLNGYKYYMKAAKLGNIQAQKNLNALCKESPWACK